MVIVVGNEHGDRSSNLDKAVCSTHSVNTLQNIMTPPILFPAMSQ